MKGFSRSRNFNWIILSVIVMLAILLFFYSGELRLFFSPGTFVVPSLTNGPDTVTYDASLGAIIVSDQQTGIVGQQTGIQYSVHTKSHA